MLQTVSTQSYPVWPSSTVNPIAIKPEPWERIIRNRRESPARLPTVNDLAVLYPEAVVASSDALAWQNVRALQLCHTLDEMVVPPSDSHCLVMSLSAPIHSSRLVWANAISKDGAGRRSGDHSRRGRLVLSISRFALQQNPASFSATSFCAKGS